MLVVSTERKGNDILPWSQNCPDLCKRQLHTDPATTSPPASLTPEPLGLGKGRDSPPSPRASLGLPNWCPRSTGGTDAHFRESIVHLSGERGWALPQVQIKLVCMDFEQPRKGGALEIGGWCGR